MSDSVDNNDASLGLNIDYCAATSCVVVTGALCMAAMQFIFQ